MPGALRPLVHIAPDTSLSWLGQASVDLEDRSDWTRQHGEMRDRRFLELDKLIASNPTEQKPARIIIGKLGRPLLSEEHKLAVKRAGWKRQAKRRRAERIAAQAHCPDCGAPQPRRRKCPDCKRAYHRAYLAKWREANQRMVHGKLVGKTLLNGGEV
jgi:hypothetical protein